MQANLRWHRPRPIYKTVGSGEITGWKWNNYVLHDQTPLLTCSSDKIRLPLNVGNSSGVNVQPWLGSGGLFEGMSHRRTFSSRTHGRPTSMAFSQAYLSSVLKKLVQEAPSLAAVRTSDGVRFLPEDRHPRSPSPDEEENRLANPWEQRRIAFSSGGGELARRRKSVVTAGPRPFQL